MSLPLLLSLFALSPSPLASAPVPASPPSVFGVTCRLREALSAAHFLEVGAAEAAGEYNDRYLHDRRALEEWLNEIEKPECGRHTMMTAGAGSMDEAATADATTIVRNFLGEKAFFENGYDGDGGNRECQLDKSDVDKVSQILLLHCIRGVRVQFVGYPSEIFVQEQQQHQQEKMS